jgi:uncharacterized protein YfaS (alpha-2-macroglobulin family)
MSRRSLSSTLATAAALLALLAPRLAAQTAAPSRPASAAAGKVAVVPDRFLRRFDPITIFFPQDTGPASGGPEDHAGRIVRIEPAQAGAFTWLDARTLQFQPADPWPALERFTVTAGGRAVRLATLMSPPVETAPRDGASGLDPVEELSISFREPLPVDALARAIVVELRPLPGLDGSASRILTPRDFEIKELERRQAGDPAVYRLRFKQPLAAGQRVFVRFRLTLEDEPGRTFAEISFSTAEPFRAVRFGCAKTQLAVSPDGASHAADDALACDADSPAVVVDFSSPPAALDAVVGRNLVRIAPAVPNLAYELNGRRLLVRGDFARDTAYRVALEPTALADSNGRPLELRAANELTLSFPRQAAYLALGASSGLVERYGPQMVPVAGRGDERVDLRVVRVPPLERSLWPFGNQPVTVREDDRPPGPGEAPPPFTDPLTAPSTAELTRQIAALSPAPASAILDLPLRRTGGAASFGLDLRETLARLAGPQAAGTYLVGLRRLDSPNERSWMRVQATDLALSTVEEPRRVLFVVSSLATARPVPGATVVVEGSFDPADDSLPATWVELYRGTTDAAGEAFWNPQGSRDDGAAQVRRIRVERGDDSLVLDPGKTADSYHDNHWASTGEGWLQWTQSGFEARGEQPPGLAHVFTERPVYRPEEPVHIKAFLRRRRSGHLLPITAPAIIVVQGPGDLEWRYPLTPSETGSVYWKFDEADTPTGAYSVRVELRDQEEQLVGTASFRKEAYRLPRFEVRLDGPERAALDREFPIRLTASYYAGGRVAARPVAWRVTQFPYDWSPKGRPGFLFSSDARFSRQDRFESTPALERADSTDEDGGATLVINPAIEPTAQPRTYVVEATVTGDDDQTVTSTRQIAAVPPLLVGLKVPRFVERPGTLKPEILVLGPDDKPRAGVKVTLRLVHRQWHAHLRASDFTDGVARYVTEVVDAPVLERQIVSGDSGVPVELPIAEAGVYVVEAEAHDTLDRAQVVAVDLFVGGEDAVSWPKPATAVFEVAPDKARYAPGETARLVLQSPFQTGEALVAVEAPDGNRYSWLPVRGGKAVFELPVEGYFTPRVPVHFLLLRGRLEGTAPQPGNATDLGRPAAFGATTWLDVDPVANRVDVALVYPQRALPGQEITVGIEMKEPGGAPAAGEVTLWLVDQAVLALGREARLDPVPSFLWPVSSYLSIRDTRSLVFGMLPFTPRPGGDGGAEEAKLLDRQTVRKNFQPVPFYAPAIVVGPDGKASVRVKLSDDLTNFMLRAKAVSGPERFGFASGKIEVRQPVVLQPALPRFVRPGDRFLASAVGRVVEGEGGAGTAQARVEGLTLEGPAEQSLAWTPNRSTRLDFPVTVPTPAVAEDGSYARREVMLRIGAQRSADGAGDAFEVRLPLRDDRDRVVLRELATLEAGKALPLPEPREAARPGTLRRKLLVSNQPGLLELAAGLDFLLEYPYGCTEQRLSTTRAQLAVRRLHEVLHLDDNAGRLDRAVADTLAWIPLVQGDDGLVAYWPGSEGSVSLTAWTAEFLAEAADGGYSVDPALRERLERALAQALRSDYGRFIDGESWSERTWALRALARLGKLDAAYGNELARRAQFLDLEDVASVLIAFERGGKADAPALAPLEQQLWQAVVVQLHQGRDTFGGLQGGRAARNGLLLPSEARTLAEMVRALRARATDTEEQKRYALLESALITRGRGDGWGSTNANAEAILALADQVTRGDGAAARLDLQSPEGTRTLSLGAGEPTAFWSSASPGPASLRLTEAGTTAVAARSETSYVPASPGSQAAARRDGFVVAREAAIHRAASDAHAAPERVAFGAPGLTVTLAVGEVVEEHLQVVNPDDRHFVAIVVPLAAGLEPLNPALETAPPEAKTEGKLTLEPTYVEFLDDQLAYYYNELPKGTYDFYFRTRAQIPGTFIQPPAKAEMMYDASVVGTSPGAVVVVESSPERSSQ